MSTNLLTTIAGVDIYEDHTYRVKYSGTSPRYDNAVWLFKYRGRGGTAHGFVVQHNDSRVVAKLKNKDLYLSTDFTGTITEVEINTCVGPKDDGTEPCGAEIIRDVPYNPAELPRCQSCVNRKARYEAEAAAADKQSHIDSSLEAALARRQSGAVEEAPVIVPRVVREAERIVAEPVDGSHPLAHRVPSLNKLHKYVARSVNGIEDFKSLDYHASRRENVLFEGPTESGKTIFIEAWSAKGGRPLVTVPCNGGVDPSSFFGIKTLKDGNVDYILSDITQAMLHGGVINLDEINFLPGKILAVFHEALDDRRQVTIPDLGYRTFDLHPECFIVASYNDGYADTRALNEATKRRFEQITWGYDAAVERQLITILPSLLKLAAEVRPLVGEDIDTPLGPSKLEKFEQHSVNLGYDYAKGRFLDSFKAGERDSIDEIFTHHEHELKAQLEAYKAQVEAA